MNLYDLIEAIREDADNYELPVYDELSTPLVGIEFYETRAVLVFDDQNPMPGGKPE